MKLKGKMKQTYMIFLMMMVATVTIAHNAIDCFQESVMFGSQSHLQAQKSDMDFLIKLDKDHLLTSVKVCTDRSLTQVQGVQASYGKFNTKGEITDAITLLAHGNVNHSTAVCTIFYIPQNDYLVSFLMKYDELGVHQVWLTTKNGLSAQYGKD